MNGKLENKFSMCLSVEEVMSENEPKWAGVPRMVLTVNTYRGKLAAIQSLRDVQEGILKGITEDKDKRRKTMADLALKVAGAVIAYAADRDDNELKRSVSYSRSDLIRGRDTTSKARCQKIYNKALRIASTLVEWGIRDTDISALLGAITAYGLIIEKPRTAKALSKAAGQEMERVFKEVDSILKDKMDKLMLQHKDAAATAAGSGTPVAALAAPADTPVILPVGDFYMQYVNAREIIDLGKRTFLSENIVILKGGVEQKIEKVVDQTLVKNTGSTIVTVRNEGSDEGMPIGPGETIKVNSPTGIIYVSDRSSTTDGKIQVKRYKK